ncbi:MAG TPA: flagellar hook-basal body complex protein FliE [Candidatus Baltobacteraceae bacterium]|nr:flagellar hook-basal body complex protein FliE [Candidatus Baltobacteraceae bacterium]
MDYASAISRVVPGTFVPDMGPSSKADEAPAIGPIPGGPAPADGTSSATPSFKDTLTQALSDVNDKLQSSDQLTRDLADGKTNDMQKVVTSVEEANLSLEYAMAVRQKLLTAYTTISQMQV